MILKLFTIIQVVSLTASILECRADGCAYYRKLVEKNESRDNLANMSYFESSQTKQVWRCHKRGQGLPPGAKLVPLLTQKPVSDPSSGGNRGPSRGKESMDALCCERKWNRAAKDLKDDVQAYGSLPVSWKPIEAKVWYDKKTRPENLSESGSDVFEFEKFVTQSDGKTRPYTFIGRKWVPEGTGWNSGHYEIGRMKNVESTQILEELAESGSDYCPAADDFGEVVGAVRREVQSRILLEKCEVEYYTRSLDSCGNMKQNMRCLICNSDPNSKHCCQISDDCTEDGQAHRAARWSKSEIEKRNFHGPVDHYVAILWNF